ncbi:hypothetical protein D1007_61490 [Hordeum vulgare]|nr:hypothetical protein D1007_61490 [Hordeum vulgare]
MPCHLIIPMNLLEWLVQHIFGNVEPYFKHKNKVIKITKDMVDKIFDFPGGTVPFVFSSDDPQVKSEVSELRSNVDYSLPRITHIKNEDFQYLALVDRNYESKKAFGFLPLRDISQTPYANVGPVNNAPVNPPEFLSVPHVEARVEEATKEEPTQPKVENIVELKDNSDLNSAFKTPIIPVRPSVVSIYSLDQATTSQPKVVSIYSLDQATTSQPKEEKNP